jgi:hypothetical protein
MVQLGKRGWRKAEPVEPAVERPTVISSALDLISGNSSMTSSISDELGLPESETINLIYGDHVQPRLFQVG